MLNKFVISLTNAFYKIKCQLPWSPHDIDKSQTQENRASGEVSIVID